MVSEPAPGLFSDHRIHAAGLCAASAEPTTSTHAANRKSSLDRDPLFVSIPSRTGNPRRQFPFPAHLYDALPARLWPPPSRHCLRSPPKTTAPRDPAPVRRASHSVLGELSYLPRSSRRGLDVTRRPAFLRDPDAPSRRSETSRCAATRSGQGPKTAHLAAARRDHGSASKLPSPGTAADQLPISVRCAKRPSSWSAYDAGRTPLAIPPSSIVQPSPDGQPTPVPPHLRSGHGAGGHLPPS